MNAITTNEILVADVSFAGAKIAINGENKMVDWDTLRAAAKQDDVSLRSVYAKLLNAAKTMAASRRAVEVVINNRTNTPHGYTAELYDMAGTFVSGRIVAADFGLDGTEDYAKRDRAEARAKLTSAGYTVR